MAELKKEYRGGDRDIVVFAETDELGQINYTFRGMSSEETAEFFKSKRGTEARRTIETITVLYNINSVGEQALRNFIYDHLLSERTEITPSDIELELCEPRAI